MFQWVNLERTVLVRMYDDGDLEVAVRDSEDGVWGPPISCDPDKYNTGPAPRIVAAEGQDAPGR